MVHSSGWSPGIGVQGEIRTSAGYPALSYRGCPRHQQVLAPVTVMWSFGLIQRDASRPLSLLTSFEMASRYRQEVQ